MRTSVTVLTLCVCVCVCVCPPFSGSIKRLYNTLITEIGFMLNAKDFQLTDFSEKASFESYSLFCPFYGMAAILFCSDMLTQHIDARVCKSVLLYSIVPCTVVVRVRARSMIFTTCGIFTVYTTKNCVARALRDYEYTASHNYTTGCECH